MILRGIYYRILSYIYNVCLNLYECIMHMLICTLKKYTFFSLVGFLFTLYILFMYNYLFTFISIFFFLFITSDKSCISFSIGFNLVFIWFYLSKYINIFSFFMLINKRKEYEEKNCENLKFLVHKIHIITYRIIA